MLYALILVLHVLVAVVLMVVVLLQSGKGGGLAGAFGGGGGSQAIFGGRGAATFLSKATTYLGAAFMITSLSLAILSGSRLQRRETSALEERARREPTTLPATGQSGFPSGELALPDEGAAGGGAEGTEATVPAEAGAGAGTEAGQAPAPAAGGEGGEAAPPSKGASPPPGGEGG